MDPLLTVKEVAAILKVHPNTVYEKTRKAKIPSVRTSNTRIRFKESEIKGWIDRRSRRALSSTAQLPKFTLNLEDYDRILLKGGRDAVNDKSRRRWNYGFGSIILRKTTEGRDRWSIDYRDRGKRIREVVKDAQTRGEALVALQSRVAESFNGRFNPVRRTEPMRFSRLAEIYLEDYAKTNKKSWICDSYALKAHLVPYFGGSRLEEITPLMIEQYRNERLRSVRKSSTNRETALLKVMFNLAITWGFASENPVLKIKQYSEKGNVKERVLSEEEETRLLAAAAPHLRPIILMLLNTGARRNEILTLKWNAVDLKQRTIRLTRLKGGQNPVVPLNERAFEVLTALRAKATSDYVFTGPKGEPLATIRTAFTNACRRAEVDGLRLHDLRHTFASRLVKAHVDIITVQSLLGHVSVTTTQRYTHTHEDQRRAAVAALEKPEHLAHHRQMEQPDASPPPATPEYSVN
jgi:excisionase family DNA binding protein